MNPPAIGVGSLRMDKGENLGYAYAAIDRMAKHGVEYYSFDIIYSEASQTRKAHAYMKLIKIRVAELMPNVTFYSGVTVNPMIRPGAFQIAKMAMENGWNIGFQDINPTREDKWK